MRESALSTKFRFICATRASVTAFRQTALGRSLECFQYPFVQVRLFPENSLGLPAVYNHAIREAVNDPAILLFVHDDIYITDFFWHTHLLTALSKFQIVGVAGNPKRAPGQPGWLPMDDVNVEELDASGIVGHGNGFPPENLSAYGAAEVEVKLLDGVFLAVDSETFRVQGLSFDEQFSFHFYDLDFCRTAERLGLKMGTATVSVIHQSTGGYSSDAWRRGYAAYLKKWGS